MNRPGDWFVPEGWLLVLWGLVVALLFLSTGCASLGDLLRVQRQEVAVPAKPEASADLLEARSRAAAALRDGVDKVLREGAEKGRSLWAGLRTVGDRLEADVGAPAVRLEIPADQETTPEIDVAAEEYGAETQAYRAEQAEWERARAERARHPEMVTTTVGSPLLGKFLSWKILSAVLGVVVAGLGALLKVYVGKLGALGTVVESIVLSVQAARQTLPPDVRAGVTAVMEGAQSKGASEVVDAVKAGKAARAAV